MPLDARVLRALVFGFGLGLIAGVLAMADYGRLIDDFFEQRMRTRVLEPWIRQAVPFTYAQCREAAFRCQGKIVVWPVAHPTKGSSLCEALGSQPLFWRNEQQVPITHDRHPFPAIAMVTGIGAQGVELLYIGSPDATFGGTTFSK